jgi:hypothetical protein
MKQKYASNITNEILFCLNEIEISLKKKNEIEIEEES